jgi:hypothetical protein
MGSGGGGKSNAIGCTLIETAKLNGVDPQARLTDVLGRIAEHKVTKLYELWKRLGNGSLITTQMFRNRGLQTSQTLLVVRSAQALRLSP